MRPELHRYCRRLTGDIWDAEDLVQETLTRAFSRRADSFDRTERVVPWLIRIATNAYIDAWRPPDHRREGSGRGGAQRRGPAGAVEKHGDDALHVVGGRATSSAFHCSTDADSPASRPASRWTPTTGRWASAVDDVRRVQR